MRFHPAIYLIAFIAHLPLLIGYCSILWKKGHYQFFPLLFGVAVYLLVTRLSGLPNSGCQTKTCQRVAIGLWIANIATLLLSAAMYSSLLIMPAIILGIAAAVTQCRGLNGLKASLPCLLLLVIIIPLPSNIDLQLINYLQFLASQLASWILDSIGIAHFREGVILVTEKKEFFTEEACSGIRSLFSSLAAISVFGVMHFYPFWRHLFNLVQTVLWVIVGNAIRVALVVYLSDNVSEEFATGTTHEMLGLGVFVFIFVLALSTNRFLDIFLSQNETLTSADELSQSDETELRSVEPTLQSNSWPVVFLIAFLCIFLFSARLTYAKMSYEGAIRFDESDLRQLSEFDLPKRIGAWSVVNFEHKFRVESSLFAPESFVWKLKSDLFSEPVIVSLDAPFDEYHDLTYCYQGIGWNASSELHYAEDVLTGHNGWTEIELKKSAEYGSVLFSAHDSNGSLILPVIARDRIRDAIANCRIVFGLSQPRTLKSLPISQIQLVTKSGSPISKNERDATLDLFKQVREILLKSSRFD